MSKSLSFKYALLLGFSLSHVLSYSLSADASKGVESKRTQVTLL